MSENNPVSRPVLSKFTVLVMLLSLTRIIAGSPAMELFQHETLNIRFDRPARLINIGMVDEEGQVSEWQLTIPVWDSRDIQISLQEAPEISAPGVYRYEYMAYNGEVLGSGEFRVKPHKSRMAGSERGLLGIATAQYPIYTNIGGQHTLHPKAGRSLYQIPVSEMALFTATRQVIRNEWVPGSGWTYSSGGSEPYKCGGHNTYHSGGQPANYYRWRLYMKYDLSSIPENAKITDAYIYIRDMREQGWGAERSPEGTPLDRTVAIATGKPLTWSDTDGYPLSQQAKAYSLSRPVVDPWGIPGVTDIRNHRVCAIDLGAHVRAWHSGETANHGLVLNALPLDQVHPSYPSHNLWHPKKECYMQDIYSSRTFLVVEMTLPPEPVQITEISSPWPDKVELSWEESGSRNFVAYKIFRSTNTGVDETSLQVASIGRRGDTTYTDQANILEKTTYYYRVGVYDATGLYVLSEEQSVTTPAFPSAVNLSVTDTGMEQITLEWTESPDDDFQKYTVHWGYGSSITTLDMMAGEITDKTTTAWTVMPLASGTSYYFAVFSYNEDNIYMRSNVVEARTTDYSPPVAPELTAEAQEMQVEISWTPVEHELFGSYQIYRALFPGVTNFDELVFIGFDSDESSFTDEVDTGGIEYYYVMYVYDLSNNYPNYSISNEVSATPAVPDP